MGCMTMNELVCGGADILCYSFGGTPKARQPLMLCLSLRPSRSHVHTSGTKPAVCLLVFLVITLTVNPLNIFSR